MWFSFRLSLPGQVVEDGREKAKFDIDKGKSHYKMMQWWTGVSCHLSCMAMLHNKLQRNEAYMQVTGIHIQFLHSTYLFPI